MTRPLRLLLAVGLLSAGALWAADFWEKKKFTEWSPKEVQKIVKDSPWARAVDIPLGGGGGGMGGGGGRGRRGGGGMSGAADASSGIGGAAEGGEGGGGGRGGGGSGMDGIQPPPSISVVVRWQSALPVKQAAARMQYGDEAATSKEASEKLARAETRYVAGIIGLPPQFLRAEPARLKQMLMSNAVLKIKDHDPIAVEDVQGDRSPDGKANLYFYFPKSAHVIKLEDKDVELVVKLGQIEVKRKFALKDMVFDGKLEI